MHRRNDRQKLPKLDKDPAARRLLLGLQCSLVVLCLATNAPALANPTGTEQTAYDEAGLLSTRMSFVLATPRRYAVRFDRANRSLEIRIAPARLEEFESGAFYDGRIVHRFVSRERNNEVFLTIQLKNSDLQWVVTHQDNPWRLLVDVWGDVSDPMSLPRPWSWNGFFASTAQPLGSAVTLAESPAVEPPEAALDNVMVADSVGSAGPAVRDPGAPQPAKDEPQAATPALAQPPQIASSASHPLLERFLAVQPPGPAESQRPPNVPMTRLARQSYLQGDASSALREYRRLATLSQREFFENGEALWLAGESALALGQNDAAQDYFLTLVSRKRNSSYSYYADLRLLDLSQVQVKPGGAPAPGASAKDSLVSKYQAIVDAPGATWSVKGLAALRILDLENDKTTAETYATLLPSLQNCAKEATLDQTVRRDCAYHALAFALGRADLVSAQGLIKTYEKEWPKDDRSSSLRSDVAQRIAKVAETMSSQQELSNWNKLESQSDPDFLKDTSDRPELLAKRARAWQAAGNSERALALYDRASEREVSPEKLMPILAQIALIASRSGQTTRSNGALGKLQAIPLRQEKGLPTEVYAQLKEIALPPSRNRLALALVLDDIYKGFQAENDIRTIVTIAESLNGAREADALFDKLLAIPSRSSAEADLKEDALMNYAEVLRNQGRLVKSADTFLAVANLDNGKNRAEAAYKAGVIYFRAGLLEKATSSWNIAANDLANSKYSALATERLDRIR